MCSFFLTVWVPLRSASKFADLSNWYNDHLHHTFAVWVFAARGFDIYRLPFSEAARGVTCPHPFVGPWGANPMVYPPGVFLVFAPPALLGRWWPMSLQSLRAWTLVWLLALAHVSLAVWWKGLDEGPPGGRGLLGIVLWLMLLRMALNGFFDVVWLGFAAMMMRDAARERFSRSLLWFGAAAFTHYRAAVLLPLALWVFLREIKHKPASLWPWHRLTLVAAPSLISLGSFFLMYPHSSVAAPGTPSLASLFAASLTPWLVILTTLTAGWVASRIGGWLPMTTVALIGAITLLEIPAYRTFWWHSCIVLAVPIVAGVMPVGASRLRQVGLATLLVLESLVFNDRQGGAFGLLAQISNDYHVQ